MDGGPDVEAGACTSALGEAFGVCECVCAHACAMFLA